MYGRLRHFDIYATFVVCLDSGSPNRNISEVRTSKCEDLCIINLPFVMQARGRILGIQ